MKKEMYQQVSFLSSYATDMVLLLQEIPISMMVVPWHQP